MVLQCRTSTNALQEYEKDWKNRKKDGKPEAEAANKEKGDASDEEDEEDDEKEDKG